MSHTVQPRRPANPEAHFSRQKPVLTLEDDRHYIEYPFEDYGFRRICQIDKSVALGLISESQYSAALGTGKVVRTASGETIIDMMNKGAIRSNWDRLWICKHDSRFWIGEAPK
jgi:hypothetical protein